MNKFMNFWLPATFVPVLLSVRYDPLSSYFYYVSIALCLPPPPRPHPTSKFCIHYCFQILLGGLYISKRIWKQFLMQNLRGKQSALWRIRKKSVGRRCVRTRCASSSLFSSTEPCCHGIFFGRAQTRALESKITPTYMYQKDRTLIKRVHLPRFLYPSLLQNLLSLFDRQSHQALVEAFQNVDYMVLKWKHWIVFIT